jgi:hypothetical protein
MESADEQLPIASTSTDPLAEFIARKLLPAICDGRKLRATEDDESEPYKSKYACSDLLVSVEQQAAALAAIQPEASTTLGQCIAYCQLERGLALLETDLVADGQSALEQALEFAWPPSLESYTAQQQAHNALGGLWCSREEFETSLDHLKTATELYGEIKASLQDSSSSSNTEEQQGQQQQESATGSVHNSWVAQLTDAAAAEPHYTTTLYYLAQVHGHAGDKVLSASYCAATLNRQLKEGESAIERPLPEVLSVTGPKQAQQCYALCTVAGNIMHVRSAQLLWLPGQCVDVHVDVDVPAQSRTRCFRGIMAAAPPKWSVAC